MSVLTYRNISAGNLAKKPGKRRDSDLSQRTISRIRHGRRRAVADSLIFYLTETDVTVWEIGRLFGIRPAFLALWRKQLTDFPVDDLQVPDLETPVTVKVNSSKAV